MYENFLLRINFTKRVVLFLYFKNYNSAKKIIWKEQNKNLILNLSWSNYIQITISFSLTKKVGKLIVCVNFLSPRTITLPKNIQRVKLYSIHAFQVNIFKHKKQISENWLFAWLNPCCRIQAEDKGKP